MEKTITEFLDKEYKDFSLYTIENRALPSVIDGLKPSQRKVIYVSYNTWRTDGKFLKVFQLAGKIASEAFYHHGNQSLESTIISMSQTFKNNLSLLEGDGIIGSLRAPEAGAPRYVGAKLDKNFKLLYKDFELLEHKYEESSKIEPYYYLPIIPTVLINGSAGLAVGYASNILNRNPINIINQCLNILSGRPIGKIDPKINEFTGTFLQDSENHKRWIIRGRYEVVNSTTLKITELPPSLTYQKYEEILDKLVDDRCIVSYDDNCKDNISYIIKFTREGLAKLDEDKIFKTLKLEESQTEIFSTLDESGKLKIFESAEEIINYFVDFRLKYYYKRKDFILNEMKHDLLVLANKGKFIKLILEDKLDIKNQSKANIITEIEKSGISTIEDSYDYLLRMPLWSLTKEQFEKLKEDFKSKKQEIEDLSKIEPKDMYVTDLNELKVKLSK